MATLYASRVLVRSCGCLFALVGGVAALYFTPPAFGEPPFHVVAMSNRPAAYVPNATWGALKLWNVSNSRRVCFSALTRQSPTGPTTQVVSSYRTGQYGNRYLQGDQLPGAEQGVLYAGFSEAANDDAGTIAMRASLTGTGVTTSNDSVIVRGAINNMLFKFREGDVPPGFGVGTRVSAFNFPLSIAPDGTILFKAFLAGTGISSSSDEVIYVRGPQMPGEMPSQFVREGDFEHPTLPVRFFQGYPFALQGGEGIAGLQSGATGSHFGLLRGSSSGNNTFAVQTGDSLPWNTPGQSVQVCGGRFAACVDGQSVSFDATLIPQGASGVWLTHGTTAVKVAGRNEPVPNLPGAFFLELTASNFPPGLYAGNHGHFAFYAGLGGPPPSRGLFRYSVEDPTPRLVVRTGDQVPGYPGLVFGDVDAGRVFIDGIGSMVFSAAVFGDALNQRWLFTWNYRTGLRVALRPGETLHLAGNDSRVVQAITLTGTVDFPLPGGRLVSDSGYYAVHVAFTDSTQAILAAQIPGTCNDIDFNNDLSEFDPVDIAAFLSVYSEGPCLPEGAICDSIDFNNEGSIFDPQDIESFLSVYSEGPCL